MQISADWFFSGWSLFKSLTELRAEEQRFVIKGSRGKMESLLILGAKMSETPAMTGGIEELTYVLEVQPAHTAAQ